MIEITLMLFHLLHSTLLKLVVAVHCNEELAAHYKTCLTSSNKTYVCFEVDSTYREKTRTCQSCILRCLLDRFLFLITKKDTCKILLYYKGSVNYFNWMLGILIDII